MNNIGIYVHIPFCASKCKYCDFFSKSGNDDEINRYVSAVNERLAKYGKELNRQRILFILAEVLRELLVQTGSHQSQKRLSLHL